jgi:hypothetical protein
VRVPEVTGRPPPQSCTDIGICSRFNMGLSKDRKSTPSNTSPHTRAISKLMQQASERERMVPPISIWRVAAAWPQLELYCFSPPVDVASCIGATTEARESTASLISLNFGGAAWKSLSACCHSRRISALQTLLFSAVCACCCHVAQAVRTHVSSNTHLRIIQALHSRHEQIPQVRKRLAHLRISDASTSPKFRTVRARALMNSQFRCTYAAY